MPIGPDQADIRAGGAVAWRPGPDGPLLGLVHRPRYDDWSYAKGKCEPGEHVVLAAVREVAEEARIRVVLGRPLGTVRYQADGRPKRVDYWAGREAGPAGVPPGEDVDLVEWLPAGAARQRRTYQRDVALLDGLLAAPVDTVPLILLRHASAGRRLTSTEADLARPLDAAGLATAGLLAGLLACFGSCQVISSAAERCLATVRPYAAAASTDVQVEPAFTVGGVVSAGAVRRGGGAGGLPDDEQDAARRAAELAAAAQPTVICAHRENLPVILRAACQALGAYPPDDKPPPKGSFWVLQSAGGSLVSAERIDPAG